MLLSILEKMAGRSLFVEPVPAEPVVPKKVYIGSGEDAFEEVPLKLLMEYELEETC